jgi:RimJ/RimL family protein N-acetyltransferase
MQNSNRLYFEKLNKENEKLIHQLYQNPENIEFLEGIDVCQDIILSHACAEKFDIGLYLIFENNTKNFIGCGGLQLQEPMNDGSLAIKNYEIEFVIILDNSSKGKGYASEFCQSFFAKISAENFDLKIPARVNFNNQSCIKLLKKFGFQEEGKTHYHNYSNEFLLLLRNFAK